MRRQRFRRQRRAPRVWRQHPVWSADGKSIFEIYAKEGRTQLASFDAADGTVTDLTQGNQAVMRFPPQLMERKSSFSSPPRRALTTFSSSIKPGAEPHQLTHANDALFCQLNLTEPEEIWYQSFDGKRIQAWVQKPPGFDPTKKYPLILNIHGGPHAAYGYIFEHEFQWMAAKGYVVLYPNPRGSTSYGQEFGNIIQYHYPGDDFKDLMAGVDELVRRGGIDEKKLGVTGGSGGGLLTNWVIGHTDRFAAAVAQRDIARLGRLVVHRRFHAVPAELVQSAALQRCGRRFQSALADHLHQQREDAADVHARRSRHRTPPGAGGEQMFRALKFRKIRP